MNAQYNPDVFPMSEMEQKYPHMYKALNNKELHIMNDIELKYAGAKYIKKEDLPKFFASDCQSTFVIRTDGNIELCWNNFDDNTEHLDQNRKFLIHDDNLSIVKSLEEGDCIVCLFMDGHEKLDCKKIEGEYVFTSYKTNLFDSYDETPEETDKKSVKVQTACINSSVEESKDDVKEVYKVKTKNKEDYETLIEGFKRDKYNCKILQTDSDNLTIDIYLTKQSWIYIGLNNKKYMKWMKTYLDDSEYSKYSCNCSN